MLDRVFFDKCFLNLLTFHQVPVDVEKTDAFFSLMGKDFESKEFAEICGRICREDNLYGKYPTPPMFYSRKVAITKNDMCQLVCESFCDKVQNHLLSGFISDSAQREFRQNLTEVEGRVLQRHGGVSTLWSEVNRDFSPRSLGAVLRELREDFENAFEVQQKIERLGHMAIEHQPNPVMLEKVHASLGMAIKRI